MKRQITRKSSNSSMQSKRINAKTGSRQSALKTLPKSLSRTSKTTASKATASKPKSNIERAKEILAARLKPLTGVKHSSAKPTSSHTAAKSSRAKLTSHSKTKISSHSSKASHAPSRSLHASAKTSSSAHAKNSSSPAKTTHTSTSSHAAKRTSASSKNVRPIKGIENLHQILVAELHDLWSVENQILEHLPTLVNMASDQKLKTALRTHLAETKTQVTRLKKIFNILHVTPAKNWSKGMDGILTDGEDMLSKISKGPSKDAWIIASAQRVEHYEVCCYGTARAHALQLKLDDVANLLKETLEEESHANKALSKIAEGTFFTSGINQQATQEEYALSRR